MFSRLNCMRLALSNSSMLRRLGEMAKLQDEKITDWKTSVSSRGKEIQLLKSKISQIQKVIKTEEKVSSTNMDSDKSPSTSLNTDTSPSKHAEATCEPDTSTANTFQASDTLKDTSGTNDLDSLKSDVKKTSSRLEQLMCEDEGENFVIDNIDIRQNVQNMTEENQNVDCHWVNANIVFNRVSGNNLIDGGCTQNVMDVDNSEVLPTIKEHLAFRKNAKIHIKRTLVKRIPCLQHLYEHVSWHIAHPHTEEMKKTNRKVLVPILLLLCTY